MASHRIHTISTRVSDDEKALLLQKANAAGLPLSEYVRTVLLGIPDEQEALELLAAEIRAMRSILFQLVTAALTRTPLTEERIQQIVDIADRTKYQRGADAVSEYRQSRKVLSNDPQTNL